MSSKQKTAGQVLLLAGLPVMLVGMMMRIMHWPAANRVRRAGMVVSFAGVILLLFSKKKSQP